MSNNVSSEKVVGNFLPVNFIISGPHAMHRNKRISWSLQFCQAQVSKNKNEFSYKSMH